jgi:outer membrane receptor protein involved in Fe transport
MVPGLHVEQRGGEGQFATVTMRGSTSAQVNIYVDGVPQNIGAEGAVDLSLISLNNVARIEVYRGYVPARFAGAPIGGVINIVTKKPSGFGGAASVGLKSLHGRVAEATFTGPLFGGSLLLGVHREQSHGDFKYTYMDSERYPDCGATVPCTRWRQSNSYQNSDALLKWQNEHWSAKAAWKRTSRFYPNRIDNTDIPDSLIDVAFGYGETAHRHQKADQFDFSLGRRQTWGNLDLGLEISYLKHEKKYRYMEAFWDPGNFNPAYIRPTEIWNSIETERYGFSMDGSYKLGERHLIEFRADFYDEELAMDGNRQFSLMEGGGYSSYVYDPRPLLYKRETWHAQISDTIALSERHDLWLTLIARWDKAKDDTALKNYWFRVNTNEDGIGTWGVVLKKEIGESWTIRFTSGAFVRYPTFYEIFGDGVSVVPGMAQQNYSLPERETGNQWDFGVDWRGDLLWAKSALSATYFGRRTENLIYPRYEPNYGTIHYVNAGRAEAYGMEFDASLSWRRVDLEALATWQKTKLLMAKPLGGLYTSEADELALMPTWETNIRLTYRLLDDSLSLFAEHHYTGEMTEAWHARYSNNSDWRRASLSVTGLGLRYRLPRGLTLTAGVDDIFDKRNDLKYKFVGPSTLLGTLGGKYHMSRYPSPGRSWYFTLDYLFGGGTSSDSSGEGSADPRATLASSSFTSDQAVGSGATPGGSSPFYTSTKLIYTRQKAQAGARPWEIGPGWEDSTFVNPPDPCNVYCLVNGTGQLSPFPGTGRKDSYFGGGLALGIDLYKFNEIPLRLELEANTHFDGRLVTPRPTAENTPLPSNATFAAGTSPTRVYYRNHSAFFNMYLDFHNDSRITPFVGAGAGLSFIRADAYTTIHTFWRGGDNNGWPETMLHNLSETVRKTNFSWNATIGLSYEISDRVTVDIAYRYVDTGFKEKTKGLGPFLEADMREDYGTVFAISNIGGLEVDLREAHQALMSLRFAF